MRGLYSSNYTIFDPPQFSLDTTFKSISVGITLSLSFGIRGSRWGWAKWRLTSHQFSQSFFYKLNHENIYKTDFKYSRSSKLRIYAL